MPDDGRHNVKSSQVVGLRDRVAIIRTLIFSVSSQVLCIILVQNMTRLTAETALVCFHHTIMISICGGGGGNVVNAMVFSDQSLDGALFNLLSKMQVSKFTRISK